MAGLDLRRFWYAVLAILVGLPALAAVHERLLADGWSEVTFDGKIANRFTLTEADGIAVASDDSVSLLQRPVSIDLNANPILTWRWRVTTPAPPTDLSVKGEDDRSLAVYVAFPFVPEEAGVMERMKRAIIEKTVGKEAPGRVLVYVWGGDGARGDRVPSPYLGKAGMMAILRPASTEPGAWFDEAVNIDEDYRNAFGSAPPDPISLAIGADTDDTMSVVRAHIADIAFVKRAEAF